MVVNSITSRVHCQAVFLIAHTQVGRRVWTIVENSIVNLDVMQMRLMNGLCPAVADRKFGSIAGIDRGDERYRSMLHVGRLPRI